MGFHLQIDNIKKLNLHLTLTYMCFNVVKFFLVVYFKHLYFSILGAYHTFINTQAVTLSYYSSTLLAYLTIMF